MHLKTLTIRGFKSFATATTLRLEPGITCIVGPNGSGKSNVVDALTWVMGEQGAKSLRGANMADVIFAGTAARPALGRAQVELTIDNSDGRLPIDYAEVTIARTLFRGGGSEYTINGASARLLDVQELLSDTGMGKQMHVIVGQGQLDAVLRATPEERREFIDEAAGVLKHRRRKERALRKLGAMDADLLRVLDLTEEIRRQLRPLARQAKAARAAAGIQDRIQRAQLHLLVDDLLQTGRRLEVDQQQVRRLRADEAAREEAVHRLDRDLREVEEAANELGRQLEQATELAHQFDSLQERLHSILTLTQERLAQLGTPAAAVSEAAVALAEEKAAEAERAREEQADVVERARQAVAAAESERREVESQQAELAREIRQAEQHAAQRQAALQRVRDREIQTRSRVAALQEALDAARLRSDQARERLVQAQTQLKAATPGAPDQEQLPRVRAELTEADLGVEAARAQLEQAQDQQRGAQAELARWQARWEALGQTVESSARAQAHEAYPLLLPAGAEQPARMDQRLRVSRGWEKALSALLSQWEQAAVIAPSPQPAQVAEAVGAASAVAAVFADSAPAQPESAPPRDADQEWSALEVVRADQLLAPALAELLADAWVCATVAQATELLAANPQAQRVATADGTVLTRHSVRGPDQSTPSLLELRSHWEDAGERAEAARRELDRATAAVASARTALTDATAAQAELKTRVRAAEEEQARLARAHSQLEAQVEAAAEAHTRSEAEVNAAGERLGVATEELERAQADAARAAEPEVPDPLPDLRSQADALTRAQQQAAAGELEAKLAFGTAQEQLRSAQRQADAFRSRWEQLQVDRAQGLEQEERRQRRAQRLERLRQRSHEARERARIHARQAADGREQLSQRVATLRSQREDLAERLERERWEQVAVSEERQQAEVAIAGTKLQHDRAREELLAQVELDPEHPDPDSRLAELTETYGPHQPVVDAEGNSEPYVRERVSAELQAAQAELARLGVVNPLAVKEYEALEARHQFLVDQVADLRKSKADLLAIIKEVDERVRLAFQEAFADTQARFAQVFSTLFPGGKGELSLTDPDDPLTTGVEIYARPAGKRVTRLSLLSGGERSLAALAYLVAIFRARPSPFYVMDEVEAALDDLNLSRVLQVMEELRADSQLIMVTHQKRTMEIADALYGVTMREGMTKVVSHKL
ncbi:chromosome segregation protein SMC [Actinomyces sp. F1_1611]